MWYKIEPNEYGEYRDATGQRVMLDWGHHIEDPQGRQNAELGYTEFASHELAAKGFGLTKIGEDERAE